MRKSRRMKEIAAKVNRLDTYKIDDAIEHLAEFSKKIKFKESVDLVVKLGIDAKKSDQIIRGAAVLPHGIGKVNRVAVLLIWMKQNPQRMQGQILLALMICWKMLSLIR